MRLRDRTERQRIQARRAELRKAVRRKSPRKVVFSTVVAVIILGVAGLGMAVDILSALSVMPQDESYSQRLERLTGELNESSSEVDEVLKELATVAEQRQEAAQKLQAELRQLEQKEKELQERVQALQDIPIPVADYFAEIAAQGERRSAWRDYVLFGAGLIAAKPIDIVLGRLFRRFTRKKAEQTLAPERPDATAGTETDQGDKEPTEHAEAVEGKDEQ